MNCRVLVADDDPDLLESLAVSLVDAGAEVVRATTGADLLELVAEDAAFDLVITDISMPWITGLQVASSMREAGLDVPLIVMTGLSDESLPERVRALGERVTLLRKPFDVKQFEAAVAVTLPSLQWTKDAEHRARP